MSWIMVGVAGAGLVKSELVDAPKEARQRQLAATTQRLSPWTGLKANPIDEADPLGSTLQGGAQGMAIGQSMQNSAAAGKLADSQNALLKAQTAKLNQQVAGAPVGANLANTFDSNGNMIQPQGLSSPNKYKLADWQI